MKKLYQDRDWLWEHYVVRKESSRIMAEEMGCSQAAISKWLRKRNISIYNRNDLWRDRNWLREHYIVQKESMYVMAKEAGCHRFIIGKWLHRYEIPVRSCGEGCHLAIGNSVTVTSGMLEFLEGELLGDGCIYMASNYSARYSCASKYEEYLTWLSKCFDERGIKQAGRITEHKSKQHGAITHHYQSKSYPELVPIYKKWYFKRGGKMKKTVPGSLRLTPMKARQWHLGDGCLTHRKQMHPSINLATCDFDYSSIKHLIGKLGRLGFKATHQRSDNSINISAYSTKEFLEWIGPCPISCYNYRWDRTKPVP